MRVAMISAGYVGLLSGRCFADVGHSVICVDTDGEKIGNSLLGNLPIYEAGLDQLVAANVRQGQLDFTTDLAAAVPDADAVFIAVGTPRAAATAAPISPMCTRRWRRLSQP